MSRTFKIQKRKRKTSPTTSARNTLAPWIWTRKSRPGGRLLRNEEPVTTAPKDADKASTSFGKHVSDLSTNAFESQCPGDILGAGQFQAKTEMATPLAPSAINMLQHSATNVEIHPCSSQSSLEVELRYPSSYTERFILFPSMSNSSKTSRHLDPLDDLITTISVILHLTTGPIGPHTKLCPVLRQSFAAHDLPVFTSTLAKLNTLLSSPLKLTRPSTPLIHHFLAQLYDRAVSPHTKRLATARHARSSTSAIYGELQPRFLSKIFRQTSLNPRSTYIDLGSGIGNTCIQAALETGCTAHGFEREAQASLVAMSHWQQFHLRCMLWGFPAQNLGKVHLYNADFLASAFVGHVLGEADVVLINNMRFDADTDLRLEALLRRKLKKGAKIVSMRPIVVGKRRKTKGMYGAEEGFEVTEHEYEEESVSWSGNKGPYYVSTRM